MRLHVRLDGPEPRGWHIDFLEKLSLAHAGVEATLCVAPTPTYAVADRLFQIETWLNWLPRMETWSPATVSEWNRFHVADPSQADLTLDLTSEPSDRSGPMMKVLFDGVAGEMGLVSAVVAGRSPIMQVISRGRIVAAGRLGAENRGLARLAFDDMLVRARNMIVSALERDLAVVIPRLPTGEDERVDGNKAKRTGLSRLAVDRVRRRVTHGIYRLCFHAPHWRVGWRRTGGRDLYDLREHPESGWKSLPDDGRRFYADPFAIEREGRVTLFVEEFEHRTGKGIISAVEMGPDGPLGVPEPVLERPYHLSYPFVFERDGETWMVPETCGSGAIELYRSTAFPGGWKLEATLVADVVASDATLCERDGTWWMFATVREGGGSYSEALHLWSAPDFRGPWTAHPRNPVLVDIASARPAGRFVERNGALYRPVQDCRDGYGAALGIARVDRLDNEGYAQTVEAIIRSGPRWSGRRIHSLNSAGGFEFIDGSRLAARWRAW